MRTMIVAALGFLACSAGFAQNSLCNPCVDPPNLSIQRDLSNLEQPPVVPFDRGTPYLGLRTLTLVESRRDVGGALVYAELVPAAQAIMPLELNVSEIRSALERGLWRVDQEGVAVTLPREDATLAFVFVRQTDGSYTGTDATSVIAESAFGLFGWPAAEYERYEIELLGWELRDGNPALLRAEVRAWRQGQRYTTRGNFFVSPDGSITNP